MPRQHRFQIGDRLQTQAQDALDGLVEAAYTCERSALLKQVNLGLEKLRFGLRLAKDLELLPFTWWLPPRALCVASAARRKPRLSWPGWNQNACASSPS